MYVYDTKIFFIVSTPKWLETHGCTISTIATDALLLKHQAISIHRAAQVPIVLDQLHTNDICRRKHDTILHFEKKIPGCLRVKQKLVCIVIDSLHEVMDFIWPFRFYI